MPVTEIMTAKQIAATLKGLAAKGTEVEVELARQAVAAKGATAGAGAKAMMAGGGTKAMMAGGGAKGVGAATGATVKGAAAAGAKTATAGGFLSAGKGLGLGLGLGVWGPVILGIVGAAAVYGYIRSRNAENAQTDVDLADALAEV